MGFLLTVAILLLFAVVLIKILDWSREPYLRLSNRKDDEITKDEINTFIYDLHHCEDVVRKLEGES